MIQTFTTRNNISKQIRDVQCVMLFFQKKRLYYEPCTTNKKQNKPKEIQTKKNNTKNNEQNKCINIEIKHINIFFNKKRGIL